MKCKVFWIAAPCSPLTVNRRFGGIYCFSLPGGKERQAIKELSSAYHLHLLIFFNLCFSPEDDGYVPPKFRAFSEQHNVTTQKTALFIKSNSKGAANYYTVILNYFRGFRGFLLNSRHFEV
jgi:hypothetical protein